MARIWCVFVVVLAAVSTGCGGAEKAVLNSAGNPVAPTAAAEGLDALPQDGVQPWEQLDSRGYVIPGATETKGASAFPASSEFAVGRDRFSEGGNVTDSGEASILVADLGATPLSYAVYRFVLGGNQPGAVAIDTNLNIGLHGRLSEYWVGVSDYANNQWQWHGPFNDAQATFTLENGDYTSSLGNIFVAVAVHGGSDLSLVGVTVSPRDGGDTTAPPALATAPQLTPRSSGIEVEWLPVIAGDLAGYSVYWSYSPFTTASDNGLRSVEWLENTTRMILPAPTSRLTWVGITAVDVNGNESALSPVASAKRLDSTAPPLMFIGVSPVSVLRGESVTLNIIPDSGAPITSYDLDLDGDGVFEITGTSTTSHSVPTDATGIIRPRVRASNTDGTAVALGSVSLIVTGNQRPVANAQCSPQAGVAPLNVAMNGTGEDFDGTIAEYAWDFDGDGIYDHNSPLDGITTENYTSPGLYNAKLRVTDDQGAWDVDTVAVYVTSGVRIEALPNYAQPGQPITLKALPNGNGLAYEWDLDGNGSYETDTGASNSVTTSISESGDHSIGVQVEMASGPDQKGTTTVRVAGWKTSLVHAALGTDGETCAMAMVNGRPAIVFTASSGPPDNFLYFVRATDALGTSWGTPVVINSVPSTDTYAGVWPALAVVNGRPAACGVVTTGGVYDLRYWRANDANGTSWGSGITVQANIGGVGNVECSMLELATTPTVPAIAYRHPSTQVLTYARATDSDGTAWATPVSPDGTASSGFQPTMQIVQGNPAIAYYRLTTQDVYYVRAADTSGATWGIPVGVATAGDCSFPSMQIVDGRPCIFYRYYDSNPTYRAFFIRPLDDLGASWGNRVTVASNSLPTQGDLTVAGGIPYALYYEGLSGDLHLSRATMPSGMGWKPAEGAGQITSLYYGIALSDVQGMPAYAAGRTVGAPTGNDLYYSRLY